MYIANCTLGILVALVALLQMLHQYRNDDVDEHELRDEHKDDKVTWRENRIDATIRFAVRPRVAIVAQCVLT
jgi:hypothetical protein